MGGRKNKPTPPREPYFKKKEKKRKNEL